MSDSYCKGCRDEPGGCERCDAQRALQGVRDLLHELNPRVVTKAEQAVLNAMTGVSQAKLIMWSNFGVPDESGEIHGAQLMDLKPLALAELSRRGLKP